MIIANASCYGSPIRSRRTTPGARRLSRPVRRRRVVCMDTPIFSDAGQTDEPPRPLGARNGSCRAIPSRERCSGDSRWKNETCWNASP